MAPVTDDLPIDPATPGTSPAGRRQILVAFGCAAFVIFALTAEMVAGSWASSPAPEWARSLAPLGWPRPLRALWWLAASAAVVGHRQALRRLGMRPRALVTIATAAPFVVFAAAIAAGADWATWH